MGATRICRLSIEVNQTNLTCVVVQPDFTFVLQLFYQDGSRIEAAFRNYFYRADHRQEKDSYDIIVCHANVIRYFVCRYLLLS